jgi:hypothetical protein
MWMLQFLKCNYSGFDWTEGHFLSEWDQNVKWINTATSAGRGRLTTALLNVEKMMVLLFDVAYLGAFNEIADYVKNTFRAQACDDVYLRFQLEMSLSSFFADISCMRVSHAFPLIAFSNPAGCRELLVAYLKACKARIDLGEIRPHLSFYGENGDFLRIVMDGFTRARVVENSHFPLYAPLAPGSVGYSQSSFMPTPTPDGWAPFVPPVPIGRPLPEKSVSTPSPSFLFGSHQSTKPISKVSGKPKAGKKRGGVENGLCLWWVVERCNAKGFKGDIKCTVKEHFSVNHPPLSSLSCDDAIAAVWVEATKKVFVEAFEGNRAKFA